MKKKYSFILIALIGLISSCKKDPIINTADRVGISKVTYYPVITVTGPTIIPVAKGATYTDPGVKAEVSGTDVPVTTQGAVDTNTDGVYTLTYVATNADGYSATANRTVVVYSTDAGAAAHDLSGNYLRAATGEISTWTKIAPGVYTVANPGGASVGRSLIVVVVNPTGYSISIPEQISSDGATSSSSDEVYNNTTPASYQWKFYNPIYGTGLRTFVKQ